MVGVYPVSTAVQRVEKKMKMEMEMEMKKLQKSEALEISGQIFLAGLGTDSRQTS
ncbi:hypothetical protein TWF481_002527 [Arthrobotrys musiformis]|uniref:Uncharacterized protein n=1 Tax=Arthrobotrys musiformis TaxID=47236 RepID=A0AAV9VVB7_9PEZI